MAMGIRGMRHCIQWVSGVAHPGAARLTTGRLSAAGQRRCGHRARTRPSALRRLGTAGLMPCCSSLCPCLPYYASSQLIGGISPF